MLGRRFPRDVERLVREVVPYMALLAPEGMGPHEAAALVEGALRCAWVREIQLRSMLGAELFSAAAARCAARVLALLAPEGCEAFGREDALLLFRALVFSRPALGLEEKRALFARYCAWRVRRREGYWWEMFLDPPRRVEVVREGPSVPVCGGDEETPLPAEPLRTSGLCPLRGSNAVVPRLKEGAALDILMALVDGVTVEIKHGWECPAGRRALVTRVGCSAGGSRVLSAACLCTR